MPEIALRQFAGGSTYIPQLPEPIRVAHLTDLHFGRVTPLATQRAAVARVNAAKPDLVVLTGDFVCRSLRYLESLTMVLSGITAPALAVLGNHDHYCGAAAVRGALEAAGIAVLENAWTTVGALQVVGLDDAHTGHADIARACRGLDTRKPTLALSHIAEEADALIARGIPLTLSGHTHGGHLAVGGINRLGLGLLAGHRYVHGLYGDRAGAGAVYVSAGIGASVMPLRIGERAQPEVAIFALGAPPSKDEHHAEQAPTPGRSLSGWLRR
ncbi:MAG: putative MPP superfamily phosphohydrolase [Myxococcota bacterium]|jgi:predicted MPP superfamily phosphohydrolase